MMMIQFFLQTTGEIVVKKLNLLRIPSVRFKLILNVPMLLIQVDSFSSLLIDDIRKLIPASSNASWSLDPIAMWLVKS